ncbi:MAG: helix-turn-helix domain-containing protein [Mycobacterium sp.]
MAAVEPSQRWFALAGQPTALVAVSRPEARVNVRRVSPTVQREIEATYGKPPAVGSSGDRLPISQAAQAFRNARLALTLTEIGLSSKKVAVWTNWVHGKPSRFSRTATHRIPPISLSSCIRGSSIRSKAADTISFTRSTRTSRMAATHEKTAEALHLHRSTLYYRLEKITEALGDLRDGEARFDLSI